MLSYEKKTNIELEVEPFYSGVELCEYLKNGNLVDLIFLDIEMDELNGVEVGRIIRETIVRKILLLYKSKILNFNKNIIGFNNTQYKMKKYAIVISLRYIIQGGFTMENIF